MADTIPDGAAERLQSALDAPYVSIRTATGNLPNSVRVFRADLRALLDERKQLWARLAELGEPETQQRIVTPGGRIYTPSERDLAMRADWLDGVRLEQRTVYPTPWRDADGTTARDTGYATGGPISADTPPPALSGGCAWPTRSLEQLAAEQGIRPVLSIHDLTAAPEDRLPAAEMKTFLANIRSLRGDSPQIHDTKTPEEPAS